jgi:CubicO group peptidase (beta-lactamase class C family)
MTETKRGHETAICFPIGGLRRLIRMGLLVVLFSSGLAMAGESPTRLPEARPADVAMDADALAKIDGMVAADLKAGKLPGCVVLVGRHGKIAFLRAYGKRQIEPSPLPMTTDTLFDLASLTKHVATATSIMLLVERGKLRIDDPVARHVPEFAAAGKEKITVRHLLTHPGRPGARQRPERLRGPPA